MKNKKKTFQVQIDIKINFDIPVEAETFEEALAKASNYSIEDFITYENVSQYQEIEVIGVYK